VSLVAPVMHICGGAGAAVAARAPRWTARLACCTTPYRPPVCPAVRRGELARARFVCPLGIYPLGGLLSMRPWGRASARVSVVTCGEGPVTITVRGTRAPDGRRCGRGPAWCARAGI